MTGVEDGLSVGARLMIHSSLYSRWVDDMVGPWEITQRGIAEALHQSREHIAKELTRLREKGYIVAKLVYVNGSKRQLKVYVPSPKGERLAKSLKRMLKGEMGPWPIGSGKREGLGAAVG